MASQSGGSAPSREGKGGAIRVVAEERENRTEEILRNITRWVRDGVQAAGEEEGNFRARVQSWARDLGLLADRGRALAAGDGAGATDPASTSRDRTRRRTPDHAGHSAVYVESVRRIMPAASDLVTLGTRVVRTVEAERDATRGATTR